MKKLPVWARYVIAIVGAIVFAKTIQDTVIVRMKNRQDGMYPSLPKEQAYWVYRRAYSKPADVARGDVVMMDSPTEGADYRYTWRVVGLPGDTVDVTASTLSINGRPLPRQLVDHLDGVTIYRETNGDVSYEIATEDCPKDVPVHVTVPPDQFYMLGDSRCGTEDSRKIGPIPFNLIRGRKL